MGLEVGGGGTKEEKKEKKERKEKIPLCESICHRPLRCRCPKMRVTMARCPYHAIIAGCRT